MSNFYKYFKENMESLGLPCPETLFGTVVAAVGTTEIILGAIEKFGTAVTIGEIIGAGTALEGLAVASALTAVFYAGACIGSIAVAIGRTTSGGRTMVGVIDSAQKYNLNRPWLVPVLRNWPGIYNKDDVARGSFRHFVAYA
jgi:hypothetical protein